ncbi:MAG: alpha-amlyase [Chloroflexi bacterium]|nr:MAG: alpha-amlyase [Chloroflexota bacterium]
MIRLVLATLVVLTTGLPSGARAAAVDWRDQSIYFVMTDRFKNGDPGNDLDSVAGRPGWWEGGDLQGIIDELGYIKSLGMTAIWITPVTEQTPGGYHGYWTLDFYKVDPHLGDLAKLKELVTKAHGMGLKIVLDVVINHTGYGHPWLDDPAHAGWFHDDCAINFASQRSIEDCRLAGLPDLNTETPAVQQYLTDWALWLIGETNVDGFRLDTARHVPKAFLSQWIAAIKRPHPDFWIVGEVFSSDYAYQASYLDAGLDAVTDFQTYDSIRMGLGTKSDLSRLTWPPALASNLMPGHDDATRATFIDNHDVARFIGSAEADDETKARLEQAIAYLYTMPGVPILYYGTEVALRGGSDPDNRRLMPWDDSNTDVRSFTTTMTRLRREDAVFQRGTYAEVLSNADELVYSRVLGDTLAIVAFNGSDTDTKDVPAEQVSIPSDKVVQLALLTPGAELRRGTAGGLTFHLPPRGIVVVTTASSLAFPTTGVAPLLEGAAFVFAGILLGALIPISGVLRMRFTRRS